VEFGDGVVLPLPSGARAEDGEAVLFGLRPEHCALGSAGLPVQVIVVEPTGRRHPALLSLQRAGSHGDDRRSRQLPPGRPDQPRALISLARICSTLRPARGSWRELSAGNGVIARSPQP
jgi:hypothetical protein